MRVFLKRLLPLAVSGSLSCWGSVNEPFRWEWQTGYRNDRIHWHMQSAADRALAYSEHIRDLQLWQNTLNLRVIYRDMALFASGSYGAFGQGICQQRFDNFDGGQDFSCMRHMSGWTFDSWGYFGYAVNLTDCRTYRVILVPFVGYGINYENSTFHKTKTMTGESGAYSLSSSLPGKQPMTWFGPLVGGFFLFQPGGNVQFESGYAFHRLHLRHSCKRHTSLVFWNAGVPVVQDESFDRLRVKDGGNLAHSGWARLEYSFSKAWRTGLFAGIQYATSRVLHPSLKNEVTHERIEEKYKMRWTSIFGSITLSRTF